MGWTVAIVMAGLVFGLLALFSAWQVLILNGSFDDE